MPTILADRIIFDKKDWLACLDPQYTGSYASNQMGDKIAAMRATHPYRNLGYLYPGFQPVPATNNSIVDSLLLNGIVKDTFAYIISQGSKLHQLDLTSNTLTTPTTFPHTIATGHAHTNITCSDVVNYSAAVAGAATAARQPRMFFSFYDDTDWDIGVYDFGTYFDDRFMSTTVATPLAAPYLAGGKQAPHPMIVGVDDILYIGDRNFIHAYDGSTGAGVNGKFSPAVLTLPDGFIVTAFARRNEFLLIFGYYKSSSGSYFLGNAKCWTWDYLSLDIRQEPYDLHDNYVSEAFEYEGTVGCFTQGRNTDPSNTKPSHMRLLQGSGFEIKASWIGNVPVRGGVDIQGKMITWLSVNPSNRGAIFAWNNNMDAPTGLNIIGEGLGASAGMLKGFTSTDQWASTGTTSAGGLEEIGANNGGYSALATIATDLAQPIFAPGMKGKVTQVQVRWANTATGGRSITLQLSDRAVTTSTIIQNLTAISGQKGLVTNYIWDANGAPLPEFDALKAVLQWDIGSGSTDAPGIDSITVKFRQKII